MEITETKQLYPEFKYFKEIYTKLNISDSIVFFGDGKTVKLIFKPYQTFQIIIGEVTPKTELLKWILNNKTIEMPLKDIISIGKTLKANIISLILETESVSFKFKTKEGEEIIYSYDNIQNFNTEKIENILTSLIHKKEFSDKLLQDDIFEIFLNENEEITETKTSMKLLEIPTGKMDCILKDGVHEILYSNKNEIGHRYVSLRSTNKDLGLTLQQIFKTI